MCVCVQRCHAHSKRRGACPLRSLSQVDFECNFQKTKHSRVICVIFDTITLYRSWLEIQCVKSSAVKLISAFADWRWARDRRVIKALRIITNHRGFCWAYECNDQSDAFRWVQGARLLTEFPGGLSSETAKRRSAYSSNSFRNYNGSFWDGSLDNEIICSLRM